MQNTKLVWDFAMVVETDRDAINPNRFDKLITALGNTVDNDKTLDKESTIYLMRSD
jgi:hypothetical protein